MTTPPKPEIPHEDALRPHSYDGIQEYDKRLPNWWLLTFYGTIVFAIVYWVYHAQTNLAPTDQARIEAQIAHIQEAKLASGAVALDDETLWKMSRDAQAVSAGAATFQTICLSCHGANLGGGIGPNLVDHTWLYGGRPTQILETVTKGTPKGMPTWGPVLGAKKISEVVSFILSKHDVGEDGMAAQQAGHPSSP
jgi:cytochrome c oxidase cbb3-type subunit 3